MIEGISVFIEEGTPCHACKNGLVLSDNDEERPVAFWCEECETNHCFHLKCCPPHLLELLKQYQKQEAAKWN